MKEVRLNDIGVIIELTIKDQDNAVVDLSVASTLQIKLTTPAQTNITTAKTATLSGSGTDGKLRYVTADGDLNEIGIWSAQAYVVIGSNKYHSTILKFKVGKVCGS